MSSSNSPIGTQESLDQILGYINFSSGTDDPRFLGNLNGLFAETEDKNTNANEVPPVFLRVHKTLCERLEYLSENNETFRNSEQAKAVLEIAFKKLPGAYRTHHRNLLFHQQPEFLFNAFFVGRIIQAVLQTGAPWDETDRIVKKTIGRLNQFLGHRQVATLTTQKIEPYENEWVGPIPIYVSGASTVHGPYQAIVAVAIDVINETDPAILRAAGFDPDNFDELCVDPRAFDFDHPINKRPNHHFGQWDEHLIDNSGNYRRFIVHQVTLDALCKRVSELCKDPGEKGEPARCPKQLTYEAGAVLAGTILMASGISGGGPGAHDSNTSLADLLPAIAGYRDQFYMDLMDRVEPEHQKRLQEEIESRRQPFGGARQHLNSQLARRRASQLVNCRLASIFARMGFANAAVEQSKVVPVASARILCQIDCLLSSATQSVRAKELADAFENVPRIVGLLKDGINCGAIVDPWNILGFDANYSLFPANENTVPDHRAYELVELIERILGLCSLLWAEAAAVDDLEMCAKIKQQFSDIVHWWRKYAAYEVMAVDAVDPEEIFQAAEHVANALNLWHKGGAAAGNIGFWKEHVTMFDSPKAYALVIDALMERSDYETSTALMVNWLDQANSIPLQQGDSSFHNLVWRWVTEQKELLADATVDQRETTWDRIRKFDDYIEANADRYGEVPEFEVGRRTGKPDPMLAEDESEIDPDNDPYKAAYEGVTYKDETDDGNDSSIFESGSNNDDELEAEVDRVMDRLEFLATIANFWRIAAAAPLPQKNEAKTNSGENNEASELEFTQQVQKRRDIVCAWITKANQNLERLNALLRAVDSYKLPAPGAAQAAMAHYDRCRLYKESLLDRIVATCVETENAIAMLAAVYSAINHLIDEQPIAKMHEGVTKNKPVITVFAALLLADPVRVKEHLPTMIEFLNENSLLYVPISKGGKPTKIVEARVLQNSIRDLLASLPSLGLLVETHELTQTALAMERNHKVARGAVTQFDDLFHVAYTSMVQCLADATNSLHESMLEVENYDHNEAQRESEMVLFDCVEMVTESMLIMWLSHSSTLRLTVLEKANKEANWKRLVDFIRRYGGGLFTQQFLQLSHVRAILHQGVNVWLEEAKLEPQDLRLFDELDQALPRQQAVRHLTLILEAVYENYNEYRDYNTTTTQSDRGELLYTLLDFLRLRGRYDRVCWNLRPVIWGHEILVRDQQNAVARMWRRSLTERVGPEAEKYLQELEQLRINYSMQMSSVGRRLEGRFAHQMQIDRIRSLVGPAMENPHSRKSTRMFELLHHETQAFCRATAGVGVDLPAWLAALENEVQQHLLPLRLRDKAYNHKIYCPVPVPVAELREQLEQLPRRHRD